MSKLGKTAGIAAIVLASGAVTYSLIACNSMSQSSHPRVVETYEASPPLLEQRVDYPNGNARQVQNYGASATTATQPSQPPHPNQRDYLAVKLNIEVDCRIDDIVRKYQEWRERHKKMFE
jgi:hypothetical protein